ncbi:MAG: hypothetical protein ACLT1T_02855 [Oscillospiraceae bacterium]
MQNAETEWNTPYHSALPKPNSGRKRKNRISAPALDRGRAAQDVAHEAHDAAVGVAAQRLRDHHALPQADPAPQRKEEQAGDGHETETADLDEQQDHHLAEHRPVRTGIDADEARDAGR